MRWKTRRAIIESSDIGFLLVDSTKFGRVTAAYLTDLRKFDVVITDGGIPEVPQTFVEVRYSVLYF